MIKVAGGYPFEAYKNCFLNLAIPVMVFTETSEVKKTEIRYKYLFLLLNENEIRVNILKKKLLAFLFLI